MSKGRIAVVAILLKRGANVNAVGKVNVFYSLPRIKSSMVERPMHRHVGILSTEKQDCFLYGFQGT